MLISKFNLSNLCTLLYLVIKNILPPFQTSRTRSSGGWWRPWRGLRGATPCRTPWGCWGGCIAWGRATSPSHTPAAPLGGWTLLLCLIIIIFESDFIIKSYFVIKSCIIINSYYHYQVLLLLSLILSLYTEIHYFKR